MHDVVCIYSCVICKHL